MVMVTVAQHLYHQTVITTKAKTRKVPISAGMMISALVTENALLGAGAMAIHTATAHQFLTCAPLTRAKTEGVPTGAGTPWNATATEIAQSGAGARAFRTADDN